MDLSPRELEVLKLVRRVACRAVDGLAKDADVWAADTGKFVDSVMRDLQYRGYITSKPREGRYVGPRRRAYGQNELDWYFRLTDKGCEALRAVEGEQP